MASTPWKIKLVGRDAELGVLEAERRRATGGEFRCVLLLADPGLGKTRLASELLARHRRSTIGLAARSFPLGGTAPFALWAEALEQHLRGLPSEEVSALCGGFLDDLAGLLRSVAAVRGSAPGHEPPRPRLLQALAVLVSNLAARAPVIAVLDDAHFADASSWETLQYLARDLAGARVLVVLAARPAELLEGAVATQVVLGLEGEGRLQRLRLSPLSPEGLRELAEAVLEEPAPAVLVDWLARRSRGNPLYALGMLQAFLEEGADPDAPELRSLPERLADQVATRLRLLDEPSLATLEMLAVLGRAVELGDIVRLSGRPLDRLSVILEGLVHLRLVVEEDRAQRLTYEIAHPLISDSIYQGIGGARRVALHRLVGRALLASGRLGEAAPHFARSAEPGDPEAIDVLRQAVGHAEEAQAYREALTILSALAALIPAGDERWRDVLDAMSLRAEWVIDHRAEIHAATSVEAMRAIDEVLERLPDPARQAAVKFRLASFLAWGTGELEEAEEACRAAIGLFEQAGDRAGRLLAANELAWVRGLLGDLEALEGGAREVLADAEAAGDRFVMVQALLALGYAALHRGRFAEAVPPYRRALEIARSEGLLHQQSRVLAHLALTLALEGRVGESFLLLDESTSVDPAAYRDSLVLEFSALVHWLAGDFPTALESAREALASNPGGVSRRRVLGLVAGVLAAAETGDLGEAHRFLAQARAAFGKRDWSYLGHYCDFAEGVLARRDGRPGEALAALGQAADRMPSTEAWPHLAFVLVELVETAGEALEPEAAAEAAGRLAEIAERVGRDLYRGLAAIGQAWAGVAAATPEPAIEAAREAVELLSGLGCQGFSGRALDALGQSLAYLERAGAVEALGQAAATFEGCSATWRRNRSVEALRGLGGVGRRAAAAAGGPSSLTRREREVARLAARGRSAREIAERLYIGERTVETHLANAYAKLGVTSKIDLVRRASELGL